MLIAYISQKAWMPENYKHGRTRALLNKPSVYRSDALWSKRLIFCSYWTDFKPVWLLWTHLQVSVNDVLLVAVLHGRYDLYEENKHSLLHVCCSQTVIKDVVEEEMWSTLTGKMKHNAGVAEDSRCLTSNSSTTVHLSDRPDTGQLNVQHLTWKHINDCKTLHVNITALFKDPTDGYWCHPDQ